MKTSHIYIAALTLLICHQIDAAYWHEWDMFRLPGGIQFFDFFNVIAFPPLLYGLTLVNHPVRFFAYAIALGALGMITACIHFAFFLFGFKQFHLPISAGLIVGAGLSGLLLIVSTMKHRKSA